MIITNLINIKKQTNKQEQKPKQNNKQMIQYICKKRNPLWNQELVYLLFKPFTLFTCPTPTNGGKIRNYYICRKQKNHIKTIIKNFEMKQFKIRDLNKTLNV